MASSEEGSENEYFNKNDEERDREINERIKQEMLGTSLSQSADEIKKIFLMFVLGRRQRVDCRTTSSFPLLIFSPSLTFVL